MKSLRSTINKILKDIKCLKCAVQQLVEGGGSGGGIQTIQEGDNITVDNTDPLNPIVSSTGGELEKITEGANTGWRLKGRDPDNYGDIGSNALDFSVSNSASTTRGATGARSVAFGLNNTVASIDSIVVGRNNNIESQQKYSAIFGDGNTLNNNGTSLDGWSFIFGEANTGRGANLTTFGWNNSNIGHSSGNNGTFITGANNSSLLSYGAMLGCGLQGNAFCTTVIGKANIEFNYDNGINPNLPESPIFIVGNGTINTSMAPLVRSDAFKILQSGLITAPTLTTALINAEVTGKVLITKEWFNANLPSGIASVTNTDNNITIDNTDPDNPDINLADNINIAENIIVNNLNSNTFSQFKGATDDNLLYISTAGDRIGIGTNTPTAKFSVVGSFNAGGTNTVINLNEAGSGTINLNTTGSTTIDTGTLSIEVGGSVGTSNQVLTSNGSVASWQNPSIPSLSKSITIPDPVDTDDPTIFFTPVAITITDVRSHIAGTTNVVFNIKHASTRTGTGLDVFTSNITLTSTDGQSNNSGFNDATIPANSWVWLDVVSVADTPTLFHSTIIYTED